MIQNERRYLEFIRQRGVGTNDQVSSSPDSYVSYLNSVSRILRIDITPDLLHHEGDVTRIMNEIRGEQADGTIRNYGSAMRQYVAMVIEHGLGPTRPTFPEFRSPDRIRADEALADWFESQEVMDTVSGSRLSKSSEERRRLMESMEAGPNNAIAPGGWNVPFLWQGREYRILKVEYRDGRAEVEVVPDEPALVAVLKGRIQTAKHHVLTYHQGFGFICLPEENHRYQGI